MRPDRHVVDGLRAWAAGEPPREAAVELLYASGVVNTVMGYVDEVGEEGQFRLDAPRLQQDLASGRADLPLTAGDRAVLEMALGLLGEAGVELAGAVTALNDEGAVQVLNALAQAHGWRGGVSDEAIPGTTPWPTPCPAGYLSLWSQPRHGGAR